MPFSPIIFVDLGEAAEDAQMRAMTLALLVSHHCVSGPPGLGVVNDYIDEAER